MHVLITDLPCIISGDVFAVLDPHKININCKDQEGDSLTGTEISVTDLCSSSSLSSCYNGLFGFKVPLDYYPNTIFRFPLRSLLANSKLSKTAYSSEKVFQNLFLSLKEEASMLLLFLNHITNISLYNYDQRSGKPKLLLDISMDTNRIPQVQAERKKCIELAKKWKDLQDTVIHLYSISINVMNAFKDESFTTNSSYLILNSVGTSDKEINEKAKELQVIPWVGIAAPCSFSTIVENCEMNVSGNKINVKSLLRLRLSEVNWQYIDPVISGHAFCFLPLPNPTGLPVSLNGYFSIADNRRSIKWPTHDEHGKGADFNKELVLKMVSYAYATMIACKCQLVSYVNTPSYLSTELSDAYSIWPLISQVKNHPIWSYLVEPVVRLIAEKKVVWTAAGGGKWVKFSEAYYQPRDLSIPNAVIDLLLAIGEPFVVLPKVVFESISTVRSLAYIIESRKVTPDLLRQLLKQFQYIPVHQAECIAILSFILSDFNDYSNSDCLLGMNIIPLMNKNASPEKLFKWHGDKMLYILPNNEYISFLPGISNHIIASNLPDEVTIKLTRLSQVANVNIKVANDEVVCKELLPLSLQQWQGGLNDRFSWYPGQRNHPPLKWIFNLWKWLATVDLNLKIVWNHAIVPQERLSSSEHWIKVVNLLSLSKCHRTSLTLDTVNSGTDSKVADLLKDLGVIIIIKSAGAFQNSGLYNNLLDLSPQNIITLFANNRQSFKIGKMQRWRVNDKQMFFQYLSSAGFTRALSNAEVKLVKELPIFRAGVSKQNYTTLCNCHFFIVQKPFGLRIDAVNVTYPDNVFYCTVEETAFLRALRCFEIMFYDYCVNYYFPFCAKQNAMQTKKNYQWILSCKSLWCGNLIKQLKSIRIVAATHTQRMVKASDLYDPEEPAISQLFDDNEDELPSQEYQRYLPQLRNLGLITWNMVIRNSQMYEHLLINRAQSVKAVLYRNGTDFTMNRSLVVATCLVDYFTKYDADVSPAFMNNIKSVKFLFCASKPVPAYPTRLKWDGSNGSNNVFSPNELFCCENGLLVGGNSKVLSGKYLKFTSCKKFQDLFKTLDIVTVIDQLNLLISCNEQNSTLPTSVYAIYGYFNDNLNHFKVHCKRLNSRWIWVGNQKCFEDVSKFAMYPFYGKQLEPFCYAITQVPQLLKYERLFSIYGIPNAFPKDTMLNVISQLKKCTNQLSTSYLDLVLSILDWVHESNRESGEIPPNILIPTNDCQLLPPNKCIIDDRGWSQSCHEHKKVVSGYSFTHRRLPLETATFLGIKLLSQYLLPSIKLEYTHTGPRQSITGRIKEALEDYDQDIDVFKEMIQNAEDAGASEIKFVIDWRNHPTEHLLTREMEAWQGPALLVYNNAVFSDDDFANICEIAAASKKIDPTKIGRFGVGFCSVYHITDVPSFVSRNYYTIFDPNLLYLEGRVTSSNPGIRIDFKTNKTESMKEFKDQFSPFCDIFQCNVFGSSKNYDGTLFRFPFRTSQGAKRSKIKQESYSKERIDKLIKTFCKKAKTMMMFLHKLNSISLFEIKHQRDMECLLQVTKEPLVNVSLVQKFKDSFQTGLAVTTVPSCQVRRFSITSNKSKEPWIVSSCIGDGKSLKIALSSNEEKGLCPLGEIAVKLDPLLLSPCPISSNLYCFMPVPIKSNFNFLINGYFDITRDRRSLRKDEHGNLTEWNSALIQDTIGLCFLQILQNLDLTKAMEADVNKCLEAYYSIWPHKVDKHGSDYNQLLYNSIKELLLETDTKLLWSYDKWVCPKIACVYSNYPKLPDDRKNEIISLLLKYGFPMVDIPSHVKELLSPIYNTVTYEKFCTDILFKNLTKIDDIDVRNNQVIQLIKCCTSILGWEYRLITANECIPTKPNGTLKKPKDLVDPSCLLAKLYSDEDECFPQEIFCEESIIASLRRLGMIFYSLTKEQLKKRASTVSTLSVDIAYNRSEEIVKYIIFNYNSSLLKIPKELNEIKFLPVMKCPNEITLPWFGAASLFEAPSKIYSKIYQNVLFTKEPIYDSAENIRILEILQQTKKIPSMDTILKHFKCLICHWLDNKINNEATNKLIGESCRAVYECLQRSNAIAAYDQNEEEFHQLKKEIGSLPFVWHNNQFFSAENVVLKWKYVTYSNYLCELSKDAENMRFEQMFRLLGIMEYPTISQCISILQRLHDEMSDEPLSSETIECCWGIAKYLVSDIPKDSDNDKLLQGLYLPDECCIMRHISNLAYKESIDHSSLDNSGLLESHFRENAYWLHQNFSGSIAKSLGIPTALESILGTIIDNNFLCGSEYGQYEDLCDRINSLLDKYPNDSAIFKEFIQNAEDAGASQIAFIIDQREFSAEDGELFSDSENWSRLHKLPSLLVYNNKTMTEDDLIGITKLGQGNKRDSLESIGRFGVGFNVAYHITDCPMFVSYGPGGNPENFCVLDPTCKYAPKANKRAPGQRWSFSDHKKYVEQFSKQLEPFLNTSKFHDEFQKLSNSWTLELDEGCVVFRLPLTKSDSNLSASKLLPNSQISLHKLQDLLESLAKDAHKLPLFIKNLKCISAFEISKNGESSHYFTTTVTMDPESATSQDNFSEGVQCEISKMKNSEFEDIEFHPVLYQKHIETTMVIQKQEDVQDPNKKDKEKTVEDWLISEQFGSEEMPREILEAGISAGLVPIGGVAINVSSPKQLDSSCNIFCSLPLPLDSYVPFHVNGHFWVDDSRKHLEKGAADNPLSQWNESLTATVISFAYFSAIDRCRKYINFRKGDTGTWYYPLFPGDCSSNKSSMLHSFELTKFVYMCIIKTGCKLFQKKQKSEHVSKKTPEWMPIQEAFFLSNKYEADEKLSEVIITFKISLTNAPIYIYYLAKKYNPVSGKYPGLITLNYMIRFLRSLQDVKKFEAFIKKDIQRLLNYCLLISNEYDDMLELKKEDEDKSYEEKCIKKINALTELFQDLPLLVTADDQLKRFDSQAPVYHYCYAQFFIHKSEDFIDERLEECELDILERCAFIKDPDITYLAINTLVPNNDIPLSLESVEDIQNFWNCLHCITLDMKITEEISQKIKYAFQKKPIILGSDNMLYPLSKRKMVIRNKDHASCKIMIKLGYPTLNIEHEIAALLANFVTSPDIGDDAMLCIHLHKKNFEEFDAACFSELQEDLLQFVHVLSSSSCIGEYISSVKKLPIFKTFNKNFEAIGEHSILLPQDYEEIPFDGFDKIINQQILIPQGAYSQIYEHLHLNSPALSDFYTQFIFEHFICMNEDDVFKHLEFLRQKQYITTDSPLSLSLATVPFMKGKIVSEYYDPEIQVFNTFLNHELFPYPPWVGKKTWLPILRILGLQVIVSGEKLIEFARIVNQASHEAPCINIVVDKAKVLLIAIGDRLCDKYLLEPWDFCEEISDIEFIPIFVDQDLKILLQKFTKENIDEYFKCKFIPFKGAIIPHHQDVNYHQISFTSNKVIDWSLENLQCNKHYQDVIAERLHISVQPSCATVVDNLLAVSRMVTSVSTQSGHSFNQRSQSVDDLQELFEAHYQFLEKYCSDNSDDVLRLKSNKIVLIRKEEFTTFLVVQCTRLVKFMPIKQDFSPYLFKIPNYFSKYVRLIKMFEIQEQPTSIHFAKILEALYLQFSHSKLPLKKSHLCFTQAKVASTQLLELLNEESIDQNEEVYYLLDEDDNLHPHKELVYNDAPWYRSRLKDGFYHFMKEPVQDKKERFSLPKCLKIPFLSLLVREKISECIFLGDNECVHERLARQSPDQSDGCKYVISLKSIIKSKQFKNGLRRIIHHQTGYAPNQKDETAISKLDKLEFKCYYNLETVLEDINTNDVISDLPEKIYCAIHDKDKMCIAPHICESVNPNDSHPPNLDEVVNEISLKLNSYLNNMIHDGLHIVQMLKSDKPDSIEKRLDLLHVKHYNEGMHSSTIVGDLLKEVPDDSDWVMFENFDIKEEVIYWNSTGNGILAIIQSMNTDKDTDDNFSTSITVTINDNKDTEVTTLFCISKLLHPSQIQSLNLDGKQAEQAITSDLLLYDIPHKSEDEAIAWITKIVKYCCYDLSSLKQRCIILKRLKFYSHYYLVICNEKAQHIYDVIKNVLEGAIYDTELLLQKLDDSIQDDDQDVSQQVAAELFINAFSQSRLPFIQPHHSTLGYYQVSSGGFRRNPTAAAAAAAGIQFSPWRPFPVAEERPQVNLQEAQIWYHQASAQYKACKHMIEYTTTSSMPGGFKCQHCTLVCFLSHEIVDLCLKALCYAFVGYKNNLRSADNILMFYKELKKSLQCPSLDIEQCVHQVCEYDRSTRFPDAHVPSEPPCCVYNEIDAYSAFNAAEKVFECVREKLSTAESPGTINLYSTPPKQGNFDVIMGICFAY